METMPLELSADLIRIAQFDTADLSREAARLLGLALFREGKVSIGRAAELCQTPLAAFMDFAARHEVSPIRYGERELEEDRRALAELGL